MPFIIIQTYPAGPYFICPGAFYEKCILSRKELFLQVHILAEFGKESPEQYPLVGTIPDLFDISACLTPMAC